MHIVRMEGLRRKLGVGVELRRGVPRDLLDGSTDVLDQSGGQDLGPVDQIVRVLDQPLHSLRARGCFMNSKPTSTPARLSV